MTMFESNQEYDEWVEMLARNNIERDGSSPMHVAKVAIADVQAVGDEITVLQSLEPYADDPSSQTRAYPKDILQGASWHSGVDNPGPQGVDSVRDLAVKILARDLDDKMVELHEEDEMESNPKIDKDDFETAYSVLEYVAHNEATDHESTILYDAQEIIADRKGNAK